MVRAILLFVIASFCTRTSLAALIPVSCTLHADASAMYFGTTVTDNPPDKVFGAVTGNIAHSASATNQTMVGSITFSSSLNTGSYLVSGDGRSASLNPFTNGNAAAHGIDTLVFDLDEPTTLYLTFFPPYAFSSPYIEELMRVTDETGTTTLASIRGQYPIFSPPQSVMLAPGRYQILTSLNVHPSISTGGSGAMSAAAYIPEPVTCGVALLGCAICAIRRRH